MKEAKRRGTKGDARRGAATVPARPGVPARGRLLVVGGIVSVIAVAAVVMVAAAPRSAAAVPIEQFTHIHGLEAPTWAAGDVFVSTHFGLIRVDTSGSWTAVGTAKHDFMGFTAHPTESGVLYSSGHPAVGSNLPNPIGFMVSRDAGLTWTSLALAGRADFHVLSVQATNGDVLYGFNVAVDPGLYRSLDGGRIWEPIDAPALVRMGGPYALAIDPDDRDVLLAGTPDGLLVSRDAGRTWQTAALAGVPVTAVTFVGDGSGRAYAYGASDDTGLVVSDDGERWTPLDFVLDGNDAVAFIAVDPERPGTVHVGSYGQSLYRYAEGRWQPLALNGVPQSP